MAEGAGETLCWFSESRTHVMMGMTSNIVSSSSFLEVLSPGGEFPAAVTFMSLDRLGKATPIG